jgi:epoxyqueuosine reductase
LPSRLTTDAVRQLAFDAGFDLAGVTAALPASDYTRYQKWIADGMAGEMNYLMDHRGAIRGDPRELLPSAKSIICVGKVYNSPHPYSTDFSDEECAWIARYAWGEDYHGVLRNGLSTLVERLKLVATEPFEWRICVDTAPLLERSYSHLAGLGWIGRNTCLINQQHGSWFFLAELLVSFELEPDQPPPDRCGTCRRCIDACPTDAIVPQADGSWALDARSCISYFTIEKRGSVEDEHFPGIGRHVFGCDICQDVCPWNRKASFTDEPAFEPKAFAPRLADLANLSEERFRELFRNTPIWRSKYAGFLRNVAIAMGNSGQNRLMAPLEKLADHPDKLVADTARAALVRLREHHVVPLAPISR